MAKRKITEVERVLLNKGIAKAKKQLSSHKRKVKPVKNKTASKTSTSVITQENTGSKRRGARFLGYERQEAVKELRYSYEKLKRRIKAIEKRYGEIPSVKEFYDRGLDKLSTRGKSLEDIEILQQDINYLSGLKTSYVSGASAFEEHIKPLLELFDTDKDAYNKIMYIYNRMVEEYSILDKFKYQVLDMIGDLTMTGRTTKEIADVVRDMYEQMYEQAMEGNENEYGWKYSFGGKVRPKY